MDTEPNTLNDISEAKAKLRIREKWGEAVSGGGLTGFLALPDVLIRSQKRLGLSSTEMMVLINILMHWWHPDRKPFPGNYSIAKRMNVSRRTVQRAINKLKEKRLITTSVHPFTEDDRTDVESSVDDEDSEEKEETPYSTVRYIDLKGLVYRLEECAVDLRAFNASNMPDGGDSD